MSADAAGNAIDPDYVTRVFGDQINATEAIEYSKFADWKLNAVQRAGRFRPTWRRRGRLSTASTRRC